MQLSFKRKALLFFLPVIILVSIAYTLMAIRTEQGLLRDEIVKRGEVVATVAAKNAELPLLSEIPELVNTAAAPLTEISDVAFVTFYNAKLKVVVHKGEKVASSPPRDLSAEKPVSVIIHPGYFEFYAPVFSFRPQEDLDFFEEPASAQTSRREHIGWVCIGLSTAVMKETARSMAADGALFAVLLLAFAIVLVQGLLGVALRPLNALFSAVQGLKEGEYPEVPAIASNDEIGQLSTEFNKMSHAIQDREQRLLQSQKRIQELFERVEHAIFRLDRDFRVTEGNKKFWRLCEADACFTDLLEESDREAFVQAAVAGNLVEAETVVHGKDSATYTVMLSLYPEEEPGHGLVGFDGHFVDVTEMKLMEEALRQTQKMEAIGILAGGVAHDFNNILTSILGYSEIVLMELDQDDPVREKIEIINSAGSRAATLTRQLLAFSRKQVMELRVVNLNELIRNMAKMLVRLIGENIELKMFLKAPNATIKADPSQVEQIIMNLAVNSRDAMPAGGSLIFETNAVLLDEEYSRVHPELSPGEYVALIVTDSGAGMPPEVRERIFEPFFTTKEKGAGTGLGLATVYGIVKQHRGSIFVYSEPGHGTTFKVYFPREEGDADALATVRREWERLPRGRETILVVDDEPSIRRMIIDTLEPLGYSMLEAANGLEALELNNHLLERIDLLLTDVVMPRMSGRELAEALEARIDGLKVLYMSGYTDNIIIQQGVLKPRTNFISKPLVGSVLAKKIRDVLDSAS